MDVNLKEINEKAEEWIAEQLENFPGSRSVIIFLKKVFFKKGLLTVYKGGIASYSLVLMVIAFYKTLLQQGLSLKAGDVLTAFCNYYGNLWNPLEVAVDVGADWFGGNKVFLRSD